MNFHEPFEILVNRLSHWMQLTMDYLPSVFVALVIFFLFYKIAGWCARLFEYIIHGRLESKTAVRLLSFFVKLFIIVWGLYLAFEILDFNEAVVSLLAGAGVLGLVLGLAFQELITNVISGISLTLKKYFHLGDEVSIGNHRGIVHALELRATVLREADGTITVIPNKDVLQSPVKNYYTTGKLRRDLYLGIPYTQDLERITKVLEEAASNLNFLHKDRKPEVLVIELAGPIMKLTFRYWVVNPIAGLNDREEQHFTIVAIKQAFDKYQIPLPSYIRTEEFKHDFDIGLITNEK